MVSREPPTQDRCLDDNVGIELLVSEASERRMQGRIGQVDASSARQCFRRHTRHLFSRPKIFAKLRYLVTRLGVQAALCLVR